MSSIAPTKAPRGNSRYSPTNGVATLSAAIVRKSNLDVSNGTGNHNGRSTSGSARSTNSSVERNDAAVSVNDRTEVERNEPTCKWPESYNTSGAVAHYVTAMANNCDVARKTATMDGYKVPLARISAKSIAVRHNAGAAASVENLRGNRSVGCHWNVAVERVGGSANVCNSTRAKTDIYSGTRKAKGSESPGTTAVETVKYGRTSHVGAISIEHELAVTSLSWTPSPNAKALATYNGKNAYNVYLVVNTIVLCLNCGSKIETFQTTGPPSKCELPSSG